MRPLRGISYKILSVVIFMAMSSCIKAASAHVPPGEAVFFRSTFAMPVILLWLLARGELPVGLVTTIPFRHLKRGLIGSMSMGLGFTGLGLLPLPEATVLGYASPLLLVIFAALMLGERVRLVRLSAVALGLCGVIVVLSPDLAALRTGRLAGSEALGAAAALAGASLGALAQVHVRRLVATETTAAIVFYFFVTASTLSLLTLPFGWVSPEPLVWLLLVGAGFSGGVAQILLTSAYREADTSLVAPFEYASVLVAIVVGYAVFAEVPHPATIIGAAIVVAAGLLILWRERQLGLRRARPRRAQTPT